MKPPTRFSVVVFPQPDGPEQAEELAFLDLEIGRLERLLRAVALGHAAEGDGGRVARAHREISG